MHSVRLLGVILSCVSLLVAAQVTRADQLNYHNDTAGTGVNTAETILTPANVNIASFSKRFTTAVDGNVYTQPLYLTGVNVTGGSAPGTHNLVFIATQHDSLYAIDADTGAIVWQDSFLTSGLANATTITSVPDGDVASDDVTPEIGICSTPVIDPSTKMLYLTAKTKQIVNGDTNNPHYVYTIYKIDVSNGAGSNANISGSFIFGDTIFDGTNTTFRTDPDPTVAQDPFVVGTGDGAITVNGQSRVYFNVLRHMNRPGLLLSNGSVYVAFGSHGDNSPYHGWLLGFDENSLSINSVLNLTPNGGLGGVWSSGVAPVVDSSGNIYLMTGNGTFDGDNQGGVVTGLTGGFPTNADYGDCFVKISPDTTTVGSQGPNGWGVKVADYFAPFNNQSLSSNDTDLGSGGCLVMPDSVGSTAHPHLLIGAGKQGQLYLVDRDNMGKFGSSDAVVESTRALNACFAIPSCFNGKLYLAGASDPGRSIAVGGGSYGMTSVTTSDTFSWPGATASVSANGTSNGIVWMLNHSSPALRAYSTDSFPTELWTSAMASGSRDALSSVTKFAVPTVANGHVYVGTNNSLVAFGLTPVAPPPPPPPPPAPTAPTVTTGLASAITATSANIACTVNPKGTDVSVSVQYGTDTSYGSNSVSVDKGGGTANVAGTIPLASLTPATIYHYRVVASNGSTANGLDKTFKTLARSTINDGNLVVNVGASGTEVSVPVIANGVATTVHIEYGTDTNYGSTTASVNIGAGATAITANLLFPNLSPSTVYHYKIVTTGPAGTFSSVDHTFTTLAFDTTVPLQKGQSVDNPAGATFATFDGPAINSHDHLAYKATLTVGVGGVTAASSIGIWADNNAGTRQLIARVGTIDQATGSTFTALGDPVYNNNNVVAFRGTVRAGVNGITAAMVAGIWCNTTGPLALVVQSGTQAAGCPSGAKYTTFTQLALPDQGGATNNGGVIFLGTLTAGAGGVTAANNVGLWAVDTSGHIQLIARTGNIVNGKTVTAITFLPALAYVGGQTRGFTQDVGDLVYIATFSDRTTGIVQVQFP